MSDQEITTILTNLIQRQRAENPDRPALIGVSGAQGSGKTTACEALAAANPRFARFSIDDLYYSRAKRDAQAASWCDICIRYPIPRDGSSIEEREAAAKLAFPLLATRGPPGTHDLALAGGVIARLFNGLPTLLPRFDKIADRPVPEGEWPLFDNGRPEAILIDGWCIGAQATEMSPPINAVEEDDILGWWRGYVDVSLRSSYATFFQSFDAIIYLRPPSWDIVRHWRGQQEVTLRGRALTAEEEAWTDRFIMHYERVTRSMMSGKIAANLVIQLDEARRIVNIDPS